MNKEKVGTITEKEKEEIKKLYERKMALNEAFLSLSTRSISNEQKDEIYEKVLADIGKTSFNFQSWWDEKSKLYNWKSVENGNWTIDFETNEIFLVSN
jgi:CXXX repeat modification system protein